MDELIGGRADICGLVCPWCGTEVAADLRAWQSSPSLTCSDCGLTLDVETPATVGVSLVARGELAA